jgi:methylenetetrahydrofolate--tRNA-(uracil-5-)-methyltransferase
MVLHCASITPSHSLCHAALHRYRAPMTHDIHIIGGGLAGSEAAWQLAQAGHKVKPLRNARLGQHDAGAPERPPRRAGLLEQLPLDDAERNAVGLLHKEMRDLGSLILPRATSTRSRRLGAGGRPRRLLRWRHRGARRHIPTSPSSASASIAAGKGLTIVATGPLTAPGLADSIGGATGKEALAFFDAIAPIVHFESIDMETAWYQSRWNKGEGKDYINCPMTKEQYYAFHAGLIAGEKTEFREWENVPYFEGCMPIEVMAERGLDTLRFGPMKGVGLDEPSTGRWPYAVVQLRQDNATGTLWNMVGFQTKLKYAAQVELFRTIPGLEKAEFARLGGLHRNTFIKSPELLDPTLRLKSRPNIRFAGQITGCEGYVESAAIGMLAGRFAAAELEGRRWRRPRARLRSARCSRTSPARPRSRPISR